VSNPITTQATETPEWPQQEWEAFVVACLSCAPELCTVFRAVAAKHLNRDADWLEQTLARIRRLVRRHGIQSREDFGKPYRVTRYDGGPVLGFEIARVNTYQGDERLLVLADGHATANVKSEFCEIEDVEIDRRLVHETKPQQSPEEKILEKISQLISTGGDLDDATPF
jgi:hypothetical protein